jgi:hypothetical protein
MNLDLTLLALATMPLRRFIWVETVVPHQALPVRAMALVELEFGSIKMQVIQPVTPLATLLYFAQTTHLQPQSPFQRTL